MKTRIPPKQSSTSHTAYLWNTRNDSVFQTCGKGRSYPLRMHVGREGVVSIFDTQILGCEIGKGKHLVEYDETSCLHKNRNLFCSCLTSIADMSFSTNGYCLVIALKNARAVNRSSQLCFNFLAMCALLREHLVQRVSFQFRCMNPLLREGI